MAHCTKCGKNVGCGCNLTNGKCTSCNMQELQEKQAQEKAAQEAAQKETE